MPNTIKNKDIRVPGNSLLILSLAFSFILLLLDFSFHAPRNEILEPLIKIMYGVSICSIMFVLANKITPDLDNKLPVINNERYYQIVFFAVVVLCFILALNIKTVGGLPSSPYASFLSSFPVFCMVMIFGSITIESCVKALLLIVGNFVLVEMFDRLAFAFFGLSLVSSKIDEFIKSDANTCLAFLVLAVTIIANIITILLAQQEHSAEQQRLGFSK